MSEKVERRMQNHDLVLWLQENIEALDEEIAKLDADREVLKELQRITWELE